MQQRQYVTACHRLIGAPGNGSGTIKVAGRQGVHCMVHRLDTGDAAFQQFFRGKALLADQPACFDSA
jgi:hypothetical protein